MDHATVAPNGDLAFRFLTDEWPERDRMAAIQDIYARAICRFEFEPSPDAPLFGEAKLRAMPGLGIAEVTSSKAQTSRTPQHAADDEMLFTVWRAGTSHVSHCGREAAIGEGDAFLTMARECSSMTFSESRFVSFRLPAKEIMTRIPDVEDRAGRRVPRHTEALNLLTSYVGVLQDARAVSTPELRRLAVTHVHDLIALSLGATGDAAEFARERGARAARLRAIKTDIAENAASEDLTVTAVAARHRLPVRYLQRLFEEDGTSFTAYLLEQRLTRAHRTLINPRLANLKVSAVAMDAGFSNLSYFNQTFRRRYGASPSDIRAQAQSVN